MPVSLTPEQLRWYISSHEIPLRGVADPVLPIEIIFRYGGFVGTDIRSFHSLGRAMDTCRSHIDQVEKTGGSVASGTVFLADQLTGSKGRFQRVWHAPPGGLWGCMILVNTFLQETNNLLALALGVSCCEAVREAGAVDYEVRWVNDVLIGSRKVAGFLMEGYETSLRREEYILVGFGINLNNNVFPEPISHEAISLRQAIGERIDRNRFCQNFLAKLSWNIGLLCYEEQHRLIQSRYSGTDGTHPLLESWKAMADCVGKQVVYGYDVLEQPRYHATITGILDDGGLEMELSDGGRIVEHGGEIRYQAEQHGTRD